MESKLTPRRRCSTSDFLRWTAITLTQWRKSTAAKSSRKKDPKQPVFFVLDWDASKNQLLWHVIYGSSQDEAKLRIAVDATSGEFVRVEK